MWQSLGDGKIALGENSLEVLFTPAALRELPQEQATYHLCLPEDTCFASPFFSLDVTWYPKISSLGLPQGEPILGFLWSLIPDNKRYTIEPGTACGKFRNTAICDRVYLPVPPGYYPASFVTIPNGGEPFRGAYMRSKREGDIPYYWGHYDGSLSFFEARVRVHDLELLRETGLTQETPIELPRFFSYSGYYPTSYEIKYIPSQGIFSFSLDNPCYFTGIPSREITLTTTSPLNLEGRGCFSQLIYYPDEALPDDLYCHFTFSYEGYTRGEIIERIYIAFGYVGATLGQRGEGVIDFSFVSLGTILTSGNIYIESHNSLLRLIMDDTPTTREFDMCQNIVELMERIVSPFDLNPNSFPGLCDVFVFYGNNITTEEAIERIKQGIIALNGYFIGEREFILPPGTFNKTNYTVHGFFYTEFDIVIRVKLTNYYVQDSFCGTANEYLYRAVFPI